MQNLSSKFPMYSLGEIFTIERGGSPRPIDQFITNDENGLNWIKIGDTKGASKFITKTAEKIKPQGLKKTRQVFEGDFLLSNSMSFGRPYILKISGCIHDGWLVIRKNEKVDPDFLYYVLSSNDSYKQFSQLAKGSTVKNLNIEAVKQVIIPLPPLLIQQAIVARLEALFSELDKGIEQLKTARQQLRTYRQAVLKAAFEGRLTESFRKRHSTPNAKALLLEIKQKKESDLNVLIQNGDKEAARIYSKVSKRVSRHKELQDIPETWTTTSIIEACFVVVDCHNKTAPYENEGILLIRTSNIRNGKLLLEDNIRYVSETTYEYWSRRCPPQPLDILFTREAPMGEAAIIPTGTKVCMGQRMMLFRTYPDKLEPKYLHYAIQEPKFQERILQSAIGTGVKHLRVGDTENLTFPICSYQEQLEVVKEIESRLSVADKLEETIAQGLQQAEALRQSILKKAFEGELNNNSVLIFKGNEDLP